MNATMKIYKAMIWKTDSEPGLRVSVTADSPEEARKVLEAEWGEGTVYDLRNEEDAERPR